MSIIITNISDDQMTTGVQNYVLRINKKVICYFKHNRSYNGLAECLRDAADAVDASDCPDRPTQQLTGEKLDRLMEALSNHCNQALEKPKKQCLVIIEIICPYCRQHLDKIDHPIHSREKKLDPTYTTDDVSKYAYCLDCDVTWRIEPITLAKVNVYT